MRPTQLQILTVTCLVDLGYTWGTIWNGGLYDVAYKIVSRLMATKGRSDDVLWDGMPVIEREMTAIIAEWMQNVYKKLEH